MKQLTIDTGVREFEINGSGVLRFNPSDPNVYNRFFAAETTLTELDAEAQKRMEQIEADFPDDNQRVGAELAVLAEYDRKIKEVLNGVFGAGNDFDEILHGVNLAAVAGNGRRVVTNLLDALTPIIREGAERSMEEKRQSRADGKGKPRRTPRCGQEIMQGWTLPTTVTVGGKPYAVHTDYRDILDIIDHLQNTDDNEQERWYIAMALFYENWRDIPAQNRQEAAERMAEFIACGKTQGKPGAKREIDWQQDAELIVGGVNKVAGGEVRALPYLHWWTFIAYFMNIGSGPLATVVGIRHKLAKGQKLEKWEQQFYRENKEIVDLRPQLTKEEEAEKQRLLALLGEA